MGGEGSNFELFYPQPLDRHVPGVWYLATSSAIFAVSR